MTKAKKKPCETCGAAGKRHQAWCELIVDLQDRVRELEDALPEEPKHDYKCKCGQCP